MSNQALTQMVKNELAKVGLTRSGADFAIQALDPMHDSVIEKVGIPNHFRGKSLVYTVRKTIKVKRPATIPAGLWDCHIAWMPTCRSTESTRYSEHKTFGSPTVNEVRQYTTEGSRLPDGVIVAHCVEAGLNTFDAARIMDPLTDGFYAIEIDEFLQNNARHQLCSAAFEVHNVTADIEKQGSVTAYRFQNCTAEEWLGVQLEAVPGVVQGTIPVWTTLGPPVKEATAKMLSGVTWDASQGVLVPILINDFEDDPVMYTSRHYRLKCPGTSSSYCGTSVQFAAGAIQAPGRGFLHFDTHSHGAYFTGLSANSALELTLTLYLEVFPDPSSGLVAITSPSPKFDEAAISTVINIQNEFLPGYPVHVNAMGDFFKGIANSVRALAKSVLPPLRVLAPVLPYGNQVLHAAEVVNAVSKKGKAKKRPVVNVQAGAGRIGR